MDEERQPLLALKQEDLTDRSGRLSSWAGQHCCERKGISCNNKTGHVEMMNLRYTYKYTLSGFDAEWDEMEHSSFWGKPTKKMGLASSSVKPICIEEERQALVRFKQDLKVLFGRLSSWVGHDCCQWEGIMQQPYRVESICPTLKS
ncbi:unnamed protein product [Prunus armeniaca]